MLLILLDFFPIRYLLTNGNYFRLTKFSRVYVELKRPNQCIHMFESSEILSMYLVLCLMDGNVLKRESVFCWKHRPNVAIITAGTKSMVI